ncbi:MAG: beta-propeller domain-containing protein [Lachnospiraceae bacterium]|nr:beta-propeller domain-containing protein [Lachnospiraceae bacterium]
MKNDEIKKAVSEIDDKFITEADPTTGKKYGSLLWKRRLQAGVTAAAVVAVAVLGGVTWRQSRLQKTETASADVAYEAQADEAAPANEADATGESTTESAADSDGSDNGDTQVAVTSQDEKDVSDKENSDDVTAMEKTDENTEDSADDSSSADAGKADSANAGSDDSSAAGGTSSTDTGKTDNNGNSSSTGNSASTGNSTGTGDSQTASNTGSEGKNHAIASSSTTIASIGDYDHAKNYGEIYDLLSERYYYYGSDLYTDDVEEFAFAEESDAGDSLSGAAKGATADSVPAAENSSASESTATGSDDFSTTNVMHEGVDEGDIVKIDGKYIYMLEDDCISITDIRNGKPGKKTEIETDDDDTEYYYHEMYVHGDVLVVVATEVETPNYKQVYNDDYDWLEKGFYIYDYDYNRDRATVAMCYDISDRTEAKYMGQVKQDGYYNTSRLIDDKLYLFTNYDMYRPDGLTRKEALKDVSVFIPCINDEPIAAKDIFIKDNYTSSCVISSFDIDDCDTIIDTKTVANGYGQIYVSDKSIYFYETEYGGYGYDTQNTHIGKISLSGGHMYGGGAAVVNGYIQDSFAIHEIDGNLMVLTTAYKKNNTTNTMFMLDPKMKEIGKISGIAEGEYVYAARYLGDYVYFITYRSIDPLFVADISDPSNPKLLGEVEIEGYSDYLHIWDDNHVLGLGFETVDNGYGGVMRAGIKLVMFDVTDPLNPVIENTLVLDDEDYCDAISYYYKALLVSPGKNLIGFGTCDYDKDYDEWYSYYLFSYSKEKGFKIKLDTSLDGNDYEYRGLYSGDNFYLVKPSDGKIDHYKL